MLTRMRAETGDFKGSIDGAEETDEKRRLGALCLPHNEPLSSRDHARTVICRLRPKRGTWNPSRDQ